jgi:hypothetical protein
MLKVMTFRVSASCFLLQSGSRSRRIRAAGKYSFFIAKLIRCRASVTKIIKAHH